MKNHKIYTTSFASVYPHYVSKVKRKGQSKTDLNRIICWLTGYSQTQLNNQIKKGTNFETFFKDAPKMHPSRRLIKGVVCGIRIENIKEKTMREIRYLDKLVDELSKGKAMEKILRKPSS
ncbi:DUF2200 domain-containing protein [Candidatus Uhrbacteria bacterium]|jgi:hypothetical protein|nr:DUF2200 domain-containing protein [Candidatus Uhrbacteria bacterium]